MIDGYATGILWETLVGRKYCLTRLLIPKAKAPSRSMSQLWHKGILEGRLPKSPSRDPSSWSWAGVLQPSSAQPSRTLHFRLKVPRAPDPDSHHLYGAQGNS